MIQQGINQIISVAGVFAAMSPEVKEKAAFRQQKRAYFKEKENVQALEQGLRKQFADKEGKIEGEASEAYKEARKITDIEGRQDELLSKALTFEPESALADVEDKAYTALGEREIAEEQRTLEQESQALDQERQDINYAKLAAEKARRNLQQKQEELRRSILQGTPSEYLLRKGGN